MRPLIFVVLLLPACSGDGDGNTDTTQTPLACDVIETVTLKELSALDWPAGTSEAHKAYDSLDGLWNAASSCDDDKDVQLRLTVGDSSQFVVVTETWPNDIDCGCTDDPSLPPDSTYDVIGLHERPNNADTLLIRIDPFPDPSAPGGGFLFEDATLAIFAPGEPISMRACANYDVEPIQGSDFTDYGAFFRRTNVGMDLDVVLTPLSGEAPTVCNYSNFRRVE